ncbi:MULTISPECIES: Flp family type IVb pilin [unclassified Devosia]|uniref:Flp family type IVb pilin n=1 Tax=unclassified Devosia TaxID=196773 RepID=UPI0032C13FE1
MLSTTFSRFIRDTSGATAIEYVLIAALLSLTALASASVLGPSIENLLKYGNAANIFAEKAANL